ncbi:MAG: transglutaminase-like domain-containing protein [Candidatus Dormibacteria bacterium]
MAELALPLLVLLTLVLGLAALPPTPALHFATGSTKLDDPAAGAAWITLALVLVMVLAGAGVVAVTVLPGQGAFALLAGAEGALAAAAAIRHLERRALALPPVVLAGLVTLLLLIYQLAHPGDSVAPLPLLLQELQGLDPTQLQYLLLIMVVWLLGAWVGWFAVAEHSGLIAAGLPLVVLVSDLINSPPATKGQPVAQVLVVAIAAVALIGWTHHERQIPLWRAMGGGTTDPGLRQHLRLVGALAVILALVALVVPPLNRHNISARFFGGAQNGGPPIDYAQSTSGYATDVVPGGPIANVGTEVLSYTTDAPSGKTYLQGEVFTDFSAGNWYPRYETSLLLDPGATLTYTGSESHLKDQRTVRISVHYLDPSTSAAPDLLYAGTPLRIPRQGGGYEVSGEGVGPNLLDVEQVMPSRGGTEVLGEGRTLTTYATVSAATPDQLERAGTAYPKWVRQFANFDDAGDITQLAAIGSAAKRMAAGATDPYLEARNIEMALRHDETYTLTPPPVPEDVWPVVYFLDTSHLGYCQYFASAMGAMLRSLGIPSRLVGGFDAGLNGAITRSDAHAWVQAYFPSYGWVNFEPTPSSFQRTTPAIPPVGSATVTPGGGKGTAGVPHPGVRPLTSSTTPHRGLALGAPAPVLQAFLGSLGGVVLILLVLLLWWSCLARSPAQLRARLALLARVGRRTRPRTQTLHELARGAAELRPSLGPPLMLLADQAERIAFGPPGDRAPRLTGWAPIARYYPLLLWRAWRAGERRRRSAAALPGGLSLAPIQDRG